MKTSFQFEAGDFCRTTGQPLSSTMSAAKLQLGSGWSWQFCDSDVEPNYRDDPASHT